MFKKYYEIKTQTYVKYLLVSSFWALYTCPFVVYTVCHFGKFWLITLNIILLYQNIDRGEHSISWNFHINIRQHKICSLKNLYSDGVVLVINEDVKYK